MIIKERGNISFLSEKQLNLLNYYTEQDSDDVSTYKTRIQNEVLREILPLI
jgi:protein involved in temperature-dependent protein secretion